MKVMCVTLGGFQDYIIQLANSLSNSQRVMLILPEWANIDSLENIDKKIYLKLFCYKSSNPVINSISIIYEMLKSIKDFRPNIVHVQGAGFIFFIIYLFSKVLNFKMVTTLHDVNRHLGEEYFLHPFVMKCAKCYSKHIFVHGTKLKESLIKEYNIIDNRISVIPIGEHEVTPFKKYDKNYKEEENTILFFGRIKKYKGLEYLIKAEPLIVKEIPNVKIIIAGKGDDLEKYQNMMVNRDKFIIYNYRISYEEGAKLFKICSLVVLPYVEASQSGVIPTAYGFCKPVVATDVGSIPEIVDHGVTGLIVPPRDEEALSRAIIYLLKNYDIRSKMGINAHKKLKRDLSWEPISNIIINVYNKVSKD